MKYQFLPPLDADQLHALRESIEANGVLQPVEIDERGEILDGHHRADIAEELGIKFPIRVVEGLDEEAKRRYAVTVNVARRQLNPTMRGAMVAQLRADGMSIRAIAAVTGLTKSTVANDVAQLSRVGQLNQPERINSRDGRRRPATQPPRTQTPAPMPEPEAARPSVDVNAASGLNSPTGPDQPGRIPVAGLPTGPVGVELPEAVTAVHGTDTARSASGTDHLLRAGEAHAGLDAGATASEAPTGVAAPVGAGADQPPAWAPDERRQHEEQVRRAQEIEAAHRYARTFVTTIQTAVVTIVAGYRFGESGLITAADLDAARASIDMLEREL